MESKPVRLVDLVGATAISRGVPTSKSLESGDIPVFSIADLRRRAAPRHFVDLEILAELHGNTAEVGDVLISIEGGTVGESFIVDDGSLNFAPSQQVATVRIGTGGTLDPWYLAAWLGSERGKQELMRLARGAGILRIPLRDLEGLQVGVPPVLEQQRIGGLFRAFQRSIQSHRDAVVTLEKLLPVEIDLAIYGRDLESTSKGGVVTQRSASVKPGSARRKRFVGGVVYPQKKAQSDE